MAVRLKFHNDGFYDLRRSPNVVAIEEAEAQRICDEANARGKGTYATGSQQGLKRPQGRWRATAVTADARAMVDNAKYNTLINLL